MKTYRIIIVCTILLCNLFHSQLIMAQNKQGGMVEVNLPDSIKGYIEFREYGGIGVQKIDSIPISNGKCIFKYTYRENPTCLSMNIFQNGKSAKAQDIIVKDPYDIADMGNIILDNNHAVIHFVPNIVTDYICTYDSIKGSGDGRLEITLPDSIHGLVYQWKLNLYSYQMNIVDSARIVNGKCVFQYNTSNILEDPLSFYVDKTHFLIIPDKIKAASSWNNLLKNNTLIKANATPKSYCDGIRGVLTGSPETDVNMQLVSKISGCRDQQGYITKDFIQKHRDSKLLFKTVSDNRNSYLSVDDLKASLNLFSENFRQSPKGKELMNYIKEREEYDKYGVSRKFNYFDVNGKRYNLNDCLNGKQLCVVVFWASWCGPCLQEIPLLKEFYKEYKDRISMVSLSIDTDYKSWANKLKQDPVEWLSLSGLPKDQNKVKNDFGTNSIPCFMVLDDKGKIIASQYILKGNQSRSLSLEDIKEIINQKIPR